MLFLVGLIIALLMWLFGRRLFIRTGLPNRAILYADVGSSFPQSAPLTSRRYGLTGKPDYLVRVEDGVVPVEVKSGRSPHSAHPHEDHLFQLAAYCLLVEDLYRVPVLYGLVRYQDRTIPVAYTPNQSYYSQSSKVSESGKASLPPSGAWPWRCAGNAEQFTFPHRKVFQQSTATPAKNAASASYSRFRRYKFQRKCFGLCTGRGWGRNFGTRSAYALYAGNNFRRCCSSSSMTGR